MNRHTKLAIIIAPFLAIGGYIASDYYANYQTNQERFLKLKPEGECRIITDECKLSNGKFHISLAERNGITQLATTHPVDQAVLSLVSSAGLTSDADENETLYKFKKAQNRLNWQVETNLTHRPDNNLIKKLRLLLTIKKTSYLAEINLNP